MQPTTGSEDVVQPEPFLTRGETAAMLRVTDSTLQRWARDGTGPRCVSRGNKWIRYRRADVEAWFDEQTSRETAQQIP